MRLLPANSTADLSEVRRLLGLTQIRLATEPELAALCPGCEIGALPPFGDLFDIPVMVDESLAAAESSAFNAATHRDVLHITSADFHELVNPIRWLRRSR